MLSGLMPGTLVGGKFRIEEQRGAGAMGVVYRATQLDVEGSPLRTVALKLISPAVSGHAGFVQRFLREVRVSAQLRGRNVATVYDCGRTDDGRLFYAMEYVDAPTLDELLREEGRLPVERAAAIARQICDALAEAHALPEPVVHRDLKPANIFVDGDHAKVVDFGIAKVMGEETGVTQTGMSPGTPVYMAPEQWTGKDVDGRADLYALGAIFFQMLEGRPPFSGTLEALLYKHLQEMPTMSASRLSPVVLRLLAKDPAHRFPDAFSASRAIREALDGSGRRAATPPRRGVRFAGFAVGGAILLVAGIFLRDFLGDRELRVELAAGLDGIADFGSEIVETVSDALVAEEGDEVASGGATSAGNRSADTIPAEVIAPPGVVRKSAFVEPVVATTTVKQTETVEPDPGLTATAAERETERREAERLEAERLEAERLEMERREAERRELERQEGERREIERQEAERLEAERMEAARLEAERRDGERREVERLRAELRRQNERARLQAEERQAMEREDAARVVAADLRSPSRPAPVVVARREPEQAKAAEAVPIHVFNWTSWEIEVSTGVGEPVRIEQRQDARPRAPVGQVRIRARTTPAAGLLAGVLQRRVREAEKLVDVRAGKQVIFQADDFGDE